MSDFSNLLGQLRASAKNVCRDDQKKRNAPTPSNASDTLAKKQKLDQETKQQGGLCLKKYCLPPDAKDLCVELSFLCIGAQKAGSSWLHEMLRRHPSLCLPEQKELHFWDWHRRRGLRWYSQQYDIRKTACKGKLSTKSILCGEITPCYVTLPKSDISEIKALFPNVKLIFLVRDLVERAWSALLMELRNASRGLAVGKFEVADNVGQRQLQKLDRESDPARYTDDYFIERLMHSTHTERSDYATGLRRWLDFFSKDQLIIIDYEKISEQPKEVLEVICGHIGIETLSLFDSLSEKDMSAKVNAAIGSTANQSIRPSLRRKMEKYLRPKAKSFNLLLEELGNEIRVSEYEK